MFELEQFAADCRAALAADRSHKHHSSVATGVIANEV